MTTRESAVAAEDLEVLERVGCQFFACPGPDEPPVDMATCYVCARVRELRVLAALDTTPQPALGDDEDDPKCTCGRYDRTDWHEWSPGCDDWPSDLDDEPLTARAHQPTPPTQAEAVAAVERVRALADDLWRVSPCGCGHRADLHTVGRYSNEPSVCVGALGICGCDWSYTRIIQTRLRAALTTAQETDQ